MTPGKKKCKMLREIRRRIADENDIPLVTEDCKYKGDCKGTCPKCESELRYLEEQLEKRRSLGRKVTVSALALGLAAGLSGCGKLSGIEASKLEGAVVPMNMETTREDEIVGKIAVTEPEDDKYPAGIGIPEESVIEADVSYVPEADGESAVETLQNNC